MMYPEIPALHVSLPSEQVGGEQRMGPRRCFARKSFLTHIISPHRRQSEMRRPLDIGCGHGVFLYFLAQLSGAAWLWNISGIDIWRRRLSLRTTGNFLL
jgi:2-polyprenyl-3-methyl-5-hydroxy-6-metoxy-1,4-benzoquinol methylase